MKGVAAGAGAAALAPLAIKGLGDIAKSLAVKGVKGAVKSPGKALQGATSNLGDHVGSAIGDKVTEKVDEVGGPAGLLKDTVKSVLPFGGGGGDKGGALGVGKGRRMPVQQSVDIGAPIDVVYNQWTQFEDWPTFMHRVTRVTQEDDCTLSFAAKIWGKTKEFTADIETQRPDERIKWSVSQGMTHTGVVTFHELGPNLTRVLLGLDVEPGSLIEKAARGMRHVKRAARADLHRFKALIEMTGRETGAWRGVIEDGELVVEHDPGYDEQREYANLDDERSDEHDGGEAVAEEPEQTAPANEERRVSRRRQRRSATGSRKSSDSSSRRRVAAKPSSRASGREAGSSGQVANKRKPRRQVHGD
jgi:uncharacterized membrane protein